MTKYEKLIKERDNFIRAAINAGSDLMKALWINRAEKISDELNTMSLNEASKEI